MRFPDVVEFSSFMTTSESLQKGCDHLRFACITKHHLGHVNLIFRLMLLFAHVKLKHSIENKEWYDFYHHRLSNDTKTK